MSARSSLTTIDRMLNSSPDRTSRIRHSVVISRAAVLAGMLDGLYHRHDPGPPVIGNAYAQQPAWQPHWLGAIERFQSSDFIAGHLGETFRHIYAQQKLHELRDFQAQVVDLDYAWHLGTV